MRQRLGNHLCACMALAVAAVGHVAGQSAVDVIGFGSSPWPAKAVVGLIVVAVVVVGGIAFLVWSAVARRRSSRKRDE